MLRLLILCCLPLLCAADDRWVEFRSGPFEVFTNAGARAGRGHLVRFEQLRHALGQITGIDDLQTPMPVRILVFRQKRETSDRVLEGRDRYAILLHDDDPPSPALMRDVTRLFLEHNSAHMPAPIERGLLDLFSTMQLTGIRVTLGAPPANRTKDWARVHLLVTSPDYYGRLRILLGNLRRGVPADVSYRNSLGKTAAEIEQETERYFAAGNYPTTEISPRPMAERDFPERPVEPAAARLMLADLLLGEESRASYEAMLKEKAYVPESQEGLGLLALRAGNREEARGRFADAMAAGSKSARAYIEYARLETDNAKALTALEQAAKLNPKLAEVRFLMAGRQSEPLRRIADLKAAATLDARQARYWQALAEAQLEQKDFREAARAWTAAEQAAADDTERVRFHQARMAIEQQRLDWEAAERKRAAEEEAREIEKLKTQARSELRALEARANRGTTPSDNVVPWWDGPKPEGRAHGDLKQMDCLGRQIRMVIEDDKHKLIKLLITDPGRITVLNRGEQALGCGPQKPRRVSVEYFPKNNPKLATVGEVATIRFQ